MKFTNDFMMRHHTENLSIRALAREAGCHPNQLRREMIKAGIDIKSRSESLQACYKTGAIVPRSGFTLTEEHRINISKANKGKLVGIRNKTNNLITKKNEAMRGRGAMKNREAALLGSKFERKVIDKLKEYGYNVIPQYDIGRNFKVDIFLSEYSIAVEIDGISHREAIYGDDKLANSIAKDATKDEHMISKGYSIVRIKDNQKSPTLFNTIKVTEFLKETIELVKSKGRVYRTLEID